jgi:hypothetical protein
LMGFGWLIGNGPPVRSSQQAMPLPSDLAVK